VVSELRVTCNGWAAQAFRIITGQEFVEHEFFLGAIPVGDGQGKEVISRYSTSVSSGKTFFTDSNGREYQTRVVNYRPTWNLTVNEPVSGNYYPVNVGAYVKDASVQFSVLTDRSIGGTSLKSGDVELMIQRRLIYDDGRGVGEPLNETDGITPYDNNGNGGVRIGTGMHVNGVHRFLADFSKDSFSMRKIREDQSKFFSPLMLQFSTSASSFVKGLTGSMLKTNLPTNVEVMTLQALENNEHLIRLSHQFAVNEDSKLSQPVTVNFDNLFNFKMNDIKEVSLTANRDVNDLPNLNWNTVDNNKNMNRWPIVPFDGVSVVINPMDIRTFTFKKGN